MSIFEEKVKRVVEQEIRDIQSPLIDHANQMNQQNNAIGQVVPDGYIAGGGALSVNAAYPGGSSISTPLVGNRLLRPGDVPIVVGGRLF